MGLFCAVIRRDSVSLSRFPLSKLCPSFLMWNFACFSFELSIESFSSHFRFLVNFDLLILMLSILFRATVISHHPHFSMKSSCSFIDVSTLSWMLLVLFLLFFFFFFWHIVCRLHLVWKAIYIFIGFLVLWSIFKILLWSTSRMVPSILRAGQQRHLSLL